MAIMILWLLMYFILKPQQAYYKRSIIFDNKPLILIGKMSYGIYLYHSVLPFYTYKIFDVLNKYLPLLIKQSRYLYIAENFCLLMCIFWLSWHYFETPLLNLKKHFNNPKPKNPVPERTEANLLQKESSAL